MILIHRSIGSSANIQNKLNWSFFPSFRSWWYYKLYKTLRIEYDLNIWWMYILLIKMNIYGTLDGSTLIPNSLWWIIWRYNNIIYISLEVNHQIINIKIGQVSIPPSISPTQSPSEITTNPWNRFGCLINGWIAIISDSDLRVLFWIFIILYFVWYFEACKISH